MSNQNRTQTDITKPPTKKLTLVLVHGIGNQKKSWAKKIIPRIEYTLIKKLKSLLGSTAPKNINEVALITHTYWEGIFKSRERNLKEKLNGFPKPILAGGNIWDRFTRAIWRMFRKFQNEVISNYIADIIGYLHKDAQRAVYQKISDSLNGARVRIGQEQGKIPLTFIAHSLGTVMTSDYIYEQNNPQSQISGPKIMKDYFILNNFFTVGSPLSLFSLRFGGPEAFTTPIQMDSPQGRWVNIVDEDDPVGMPLKVLNEAYNKVILKDVVINAGVYGISHVGYFKKSAKTLDIICQKLAIDWIAINELLPRERVEELYREYDERCGLSNVKTS